MTVSCRYPEASQGEHRQRFVPAISCSGRIPEGGLARFYRELDGHLSGRWLKSEHHACAVRLYVVYREVEVSRGRPGGLAEFAELLGIRLNRLYNFMMGAAGRCGYRLELLSDWSSVLTDHWREEGIAIYLLVHPHGLVEPLMEQFSEE